MQGALIILAVTVVAGIILYLNHVREERKAAAEGAASETSNESPAADGESGSEKEAEGPEVCCGMHLVCEKTSLSPMSPDIEYYDDEELDRFRGRTSDDYDDAEIDEFMDVLLTMRPADVAGWSRSLQLRGINPPILVRDQILLIVSEQRV